MSDNSSDKQLRVCVIGAGAMGLAALRHLTASPLTFRATAFEQSSRVGGMWAYTDDAGQDAYGLPIHSSVYKYMKVNFVKEGMAFPDFAFPDELPSFPTHDHVLRYLEDYAAHFQLMDHIKLLHQVVRVAPATDGDGKWEVQVQKVDKSAPAMHLLFDAVMVCNGHYSVPLIPDLHGLKDFRGGVLHSHAYRYPEHFSQARVLVVGAGGSGRDIAMDLMPHAKQVILLHRMPDLIPTILPQNVSQTNRGIVTFKTKSVLLDNGTDLEIDHVILCTGYHYSFPFLSHECQLINDNEHLSPLYKHIFHINHPTLSFIGLVKVSLWWPLSYLQIRYVLATLSGTKPLPSRDEMLMEEQRYVTWKTKERKMPKKKMHSLGSEMWLYSDELAKLGGSKPLPPFLEKLVDYVFYETREHDLLHYKEREYRIINDNEFEVVSYRGKALKSKI